MTPRAFFLRAFFCALSALHTQTIRYFMARPNLVADCAQCCALCCVALSFERSKDFAFDKPAHVPCPKLSSDHRCSIHSELIEKGCAGCVRYQCYGAGQRVTRLFGGAAWQHDEYGAKEMFDAFFVVRSLHELLSLLESARDVASGTSLETPLEELLRDVDAAAALPREALLRVEPDTLVRRAHVLLRALRPYVEGQRENQLAPEG